jgi:hypothetical protein
MKKIYFLFLFLLPLISYSQKQGNIWYFADSTGLDFNSGNATPISTGNIFSTHGVEGTATICDSSGNLLFYADGEKVWGRNHLVMPNGNGLMGGVSSTQAVFIVPVPGTDTLFYLFTTDEFQNNLQNGLRYSLVDICMHGGYGDVVAGQKNILLLDTVAEKMAVTDHTNGMDYWLVVHKYYSDAFYSYHISSAGIVDTVISHVGIFEPNQPNNVGAAIGQMKISPDGTKLALAFSNTYPEVVELYDFDHTTGIVSNEISLPTNGGEYGVEFSPDNSKLYVTCLNAHSLYQYNISSGNPASIVASKTLIYNNSWPMAGMQLGPDGRIYIVDNTFMDVINDPNNAGVNCNYLHNAFNLYGHRSDYGIANFISSYHYHNGVPKCVFVDDVNEIKAENSITLFPSPFSTTATLQFGVGLHYQNTHFQLYDIFGREVQNLAIENSTMQIERENLVAGIYFWTVKDGEKIIAIGKIAVE